MRKRKKDHLDGFDMRKFTSYIHSDVKDFSEIKSLNELDDQIEIVKMLIKKNTIIIIFVIIIPLLIMTFNKQYNIRTKERIENKELAENKGSIKDNTVESVISDEKTKELDFSNEQWVKDVITPISKNKQSLGIAIPNFAIKNDNIVYVEVDSLQSLYIRHLTDNYKKPLVRENNIRLVNMSDNYITYIRDNSTEVEADDIVFIDYDGNVVNEVKPNIGNDRIVSYYIGGNNLIFTTENSNVFKSDLSNGELIELTEFENNFKIIEGLVDGELKFISDDYDYYLNLEDYTVDKRDILPYNFFDVDGKKYFTDIINDNQVRILDENTDIIDDNILSYGIYEDKIFILSNNELKMYNTKLNSKRGTNINTDDVVGFYIYDDYIITLNSKGTGLFGGYLDVYRISSIVK